METTQSLGTEGVVRKRIGEMGENIQKVGQIASELAKESLTHLRENASDYYKKGIDRAGDLEKKFEERVNTHPLAALALAVVCGVVLGTLWKKS